MTIAMHAQPPHVEPVFQNAVRLRQDGLPTHERHYAMWMHLSPLVAFLVLGPLALAAPLVMWLMRKDTSPFADDHGKEVVNLSITGAIVTFLAWIPVIGWFGAPIWMIVAIISIIRGSMAATNGEYFRYPLTCRFIS
ncbi:MAG: DUF4870 domain-containing protein [Planctomycetes bacterium]|nr:DUF4870 domain-containing protein [Planctomycetota bacterium]